LAIANFIRTGSPMTADNRYDRSPHDLNDELSGRARLFVSDARSLWDDKCRGHQIGSLV
jgi:hypothetical protein